VNDNRGSTIAEDGVFVRAESHVGRDRAGMSRAVGPDDQSKVRNIARGKTFMHAFMRMASTKMRASGFEIRRLALRELMNVNGMLARRKILDIERNLDAFGRRRQRGSANTLALRILDVHGNGLIGGADLAGLHAKQAHCRQQKCSTNK